MTGTLRAVFSGALDPALNMALDEALLRSEGPPTLRIYAWSPPGLSLGYFQRSAVFADLPGDHVVVRRLTGGGAIHHEGDITFALTADLDAVPTALHESYAVVHSAIERALVAVGVPAHRPDAAHVATDARATAPWCLAGGGPHDVVTSPGRKIVGSAQRRIREPRPRVLHHGTVPLTRPSLAPDCAAVADHVDAAACAEELRRRMAEEIARALRLRLDPGEPTAPEMAMARDLARSRYDDPAFTHRR